VLVDNKSTKKFNREELWEGMERKENRKKGKWVKISTARTTDKGSIQYSSGQNLTKAACDALLTKRVNTKELEMMKGFLDSRPTLIWVLPKNPRQTDSQTELPNSA
jgi:hypothetical protein